LSIKTIQLDFTRVRPCKQFTVFIAKITGGNSKIAFGKPKLLQQTSGAISHRSSNGLPRVGNYTSHLRCQPSNPELAHEQKENRLLIPNLLAALAPMGHHSECFPH
jgi:hypothetical protein